MASCASTAFVDRAPAELVLARPPSALVDDCPRPVLIPAGTRTQADIEALWGRDRVSLKLCREEKAQLVKFYSARDDALRNRE